MIHMLIGIQGSGKSTFANELNREKGYKIISTDQVRKDNPGIEEALVWPNVYNQAAEALKNNVEAIFDATNITPKARKRFFDNVRNLGVEPVVGAYFFDVDVEICHERVIKRNENKDELYLPPEVVYSYAENIIKPTLDEGFVFIKIVKNGKVID